MKSINTLVVLVLVNLAFGAGYPFVKAILQYLPPANWLFVRCSVSALILVLITNQKMVRQNISFKNLFWLIIATLFGVLLNQICFVEGLKLTLPAHTAIINATIPLQTLLFASIFLGERLTKARVWGVVLGFAGIFYLLGLHQSLRLNAFVQGDLLSLANAASYSIYLVIARKHLQGLSPLVALTIMTLMGLVGFGVYANWDFPVHKIIELPHTIWLTMIYLMVVPSVIGYLAYLWALKRIEASQAALFCYLQPISAIVFSFVLFGDIPQPRFYVSAGLIFVGILLGNMKR